MDAPQQPESVGVTDDHRCPFCGSRLPGMVAFCRHCGEDLQNQQQEWERTGAVRRDCEPDRGILIQALGLTAMILSLLHVLAVAGFPLSFVVWRMSRRDLRLMAAGLMSHEGRKPTQFGHACAVIGLVVGGMWLLIFFFVLLAVSWKW